MAKQRKECAWYLNHLAAPEAMACVRWRACGPNLRRSAGRACVDGLTLSRWGRGSKPEGPFCVPSGFGELLGAALQGGARLSVPVAREMDPSAPSPGVLYIASARALPRVRVSN